MLKKRGIALVTTICMLLGTIQLVPVYAEDSAQSTGTASYTWSFGDNNLNDSNLADMNMSIEARNGNGVSATSRSTFKVVEDAAAESGKALEWVAKTDTPADGASGKASYMYEDLYFNLPNAIKTADGPFTITMRYNVKDYPKRTDGTCSFVGTTGSDAANLNFGMVNWDIVGQEIYNKLYVNNNMWYTHSNNFTPNAFNTISAGSGTINTYITYKYYVDPATGTFKADYSYTDTNNKVYSKETYGAYKLLTGSLPEQIDKLRFSVYEFKKLGDSNSLTGYEKSATYLIDYVKIEQTNELEVSGTEPASGELFTGNTASVSFNTAIDSSTINGDSVKVTKNGDALVYGSDYTASVDAADASKLNITLAKDAANNEKYTVCITTDINNSTGYAKLKNNYTFYPVTNHTYVDYTFDFSNIAEKTYTVKTDVTDIDNFSTDTQYADFSIVKDSTLNKNVLKWYWAGGQLDSVTGKHTDNENIYFDLPQPLKPENGAFTIEMRYMVADNPRSQNGSANLIGTTNNQAASLPFGVGSWDNSGQEPSEKLYYEGSLYKAKDVKWDINNGNGTPNMQSYFLNRDASKIGKYLTYRFVVNPADGTYRAYWKYDSDTSWNEPFAKSVANGDIKYPFKVGTMPETISKLNFSLFQTLNGTTDAITAAKAKSSTYYMDYIKVEQKPLTVTDCTKTTTADNKTALSVNFDSEIAAATATADTVKLYQNGNALTFGTDYKVTFAGDENKNMIITLECETAETDNIVLVIEDGINATSGYSKLLQAYKFSTKNSVQISAVSFKNENGAVIDAPTAAKGTLTVNASVVNNSDDEISAATVLVAVFDSNHNMIKCSMNNIDTQLEKGKYKEITSTLTDLGDDIGSAEVFVFNNMTSIVPLAAAYKSGN